MAAQAMARVYNSTEITAVRFNDAQQCWVLVDSKTQKQRRLKGVRRILTSKCWPSYCYEDAASAVPKAKRARSGVYAGRGRWAAANAGRRRGEEVHTQLGIVASHGYEKLKEHLKTKHPNARDKRGQPHPFVKEVLHRFDQLKWTLVAAETPVYNEYYGSSIDLICIRREDNKLVIIELKVGGTNYYDKHSGWMEGALARAGIDNSPLSQALVQLGAYRLLFETMYTKYVDASLIDSYRVLFVGQHDQHIHIHVKKLDDELWSKMAQPLASFLYDEPKKSTQKK